MFPIIQQKCLWFGLTIPGFQAFDVVVVEVLGEDGGGFALQSPWPNISEEFLVA